MTALYILLHTDNDHVNCAVSSMEALCNLNSLNKSNQPEVEVAKVVGLVLRGSVQIDGKIGNFELFDAWATRHRHQQGQGVDDFSPHHCSLPPHHRWLWASGFLSSDKLPPATGASHGNLKIGMIGRFGRSVHRLVSSTTARILRNGRFIH